MDLAVRIAVVGAVPVLEASGEIDLASVPQFRDACFRLVGEHPGVVVALDLDGVSVLDDVGLGIVLGAAGRAREHGGDLVVVCTMPKLLARFERSGLARAVDVRDRLST